MCRAQAPCHPDRQFCRPDRSFAVLSVSRRTCYPCHPDRAKRVEGFALQPLLSSKEKWKNAHANKNAFAAFSIPLSLSNVGTQNEDFPDTSSILSCHLGHQPRGLLVEADSPTPVLRTYARNDRKSKNRRKEKFFSRFFFFRMFLYCFILIFVLRRCLCFARSVVLVYIFIYFCL